MGQDNGHNSCRRDGAVGKYSVSFFTMGRDDESKFLVTVFAAVVQVVAALVVVVVFIFLLSE